MGSADVIADVSDILVHVLTAAVRESEAQARVHLVELVGRHRGGGHGRLGLERERNRPWRMAFPPSAPLCPRLRLAGLARLDLTGAGVMATPDIHPSASAELAFRRR
ncbi:hypothetical protein OG819_43685 [Streptomyces sp. NBC_01549]|uniref:hypothetical protein n=1 Tax=Streptomyces sp. NBC_01549 TaxID=2975874 RepID=UPI0022526800|nr:hypothetical protein [Streptomyces sp. NBC_01549]MCX4596314.1 hypothetical protein [Streptomyces sp. NBC_01549]